MLAGEAIVSPAIVARGGNMQLSIHLRWATRVFLLIVVLTFNCLECLHTLQPIPLPTRLGRAWVVPPVRCLCICLLLLIWSIRVFKQNGNTLDLKNGKNPESKTCCILAPRDFYLVAPIYFCPIINQATQKIHLIKRSMNKTSSHSPDQLQTPRRAQKTDLLSAEQEARRCEDLAGVSNDFHLWHFCNKVQTELGSPCSPLSLPTPLSTHGNELTV